MTATVTIITREADDAVLVPNSAITYAEGQSSASSTGTAKVDVLENGVPRPRPIQIGLSDGVNTQVLSGLQPGEQVVTASSGGPQRATSSGSSIFGSAGGNRGGGTGGGGGAGGAARGAGG